MLKLYALLLMALGWPALAAAQVNFVTTTGTNANYANGTITANFLPPANSSQFDYINERFPFTQSATLNSSGTWSLSVADTSTLKPASSQWQLNLCSQKTSTATPTCFLVTMPVTCVNNGSCSGSTLDLSSSFFGAPVPPTAPVPNSGGLNASLLPHWIACTAKVKINAGSCNVYAVGDSTTFGVCSNNTCSATGELTAASYPTRLTQYLNTALMPAQRDSFSGQGNGINGAGVNDARVVIGSFGQGPVSVGGPLFTASAVGSPLTFTPTDNVDTFIVRFQTGVGFGVGSYTIDGGTPVTFNTSVTSGGGLTSVTAAAGSLGPHTIAINWVSGGNIRILGINASNSTQGAVMITNAGIPSATSGTWNSSISPVAPLPAMVTLAPDLILLDLGINDWQTALPLATYIANMQALISAWKVNSDIILVTPAPSAITTKPLATQQQYVAAMFALAAANNLPIIDNFNRWGSFERMNATPFLFYGNTIHPNGNGYSENAQSDATQLLSVVGH